MLFCVCVSLFYHEYCDCECYCLEADSNVVDMQVMCSGVSLEFHVAGISTVVGGALSQGVRARKLGQCKLRRKKQLHVNEATSLHVINSKSMKFGVSYNWENIILKHG